MGKEAVSIGANTFQFFTRNPRGGAAKPINEADMAAYAEFAKENEMGTILAHAPYVLNPAAAKEDLREFAFEVMKDDFHRLSLGAVMYQPSDRTFFIPNMGTVYDAENKQIISSPDMVKQGINGQQDQNQNLNNEEEEDDNNE